ncbi:hypothetical protein [uncultured Cellulomonas sp.]|uniref:hypothetical protein n=1 Tax=uncultured Cellulomonas sp. TaxID=189682 RepID=UPI002617FF86|nr:hypothetical protein [uncultured Cellulomonas sp.]
MSLRDQLEAMGPERVVLVLTTLGQVHVGRLTDIEGDALVVERPDRGSQTVLSLDDVSGVRLYDEEAES